MIEAAIEWTASVTAGKGTAAPLARRVRRPAIAVPPRPGVIRVGAYYGNVYVGGAEVWLRTLLRHLPAPCRAVGVAVERAGELPTVDFAGVPLTRHLPALLASSDALIAWGVRSLRHVRETFRGPVVFIGHSGAELLWMGQRLAPDATQHVAVSRFCLASIPEPYRSSAVVIPNGIEPLPLPPRQAARKKLGIGDRLAVGFVGRWSEEKDPFAAARAVAALPGSVAVYHGYRAKGEPAFRREIERLTGGRALFRTPRQSVAETYAALDCFIHTPPFEGFGLTYCEAWQAGVPVVSSLAGVVAECGRAEEVATLVPAEADGRTLAAAVRRAVRGGTVAAGRAIVAERYTAAAMGAAYARLLAAAASEPRTRRAVA